MLPFKTNTTRWLKEKEYLNGNPMVFRPIPATVGLVGQYLGYAKRDIRSAYVLYSEEYGWNDYLVNKSYTPFTYNKKSLTNAAPVMTYDGVDRCILILLSAAVGLAIQLIQLMSICCC